MGKTFVPGNETIIDADKGIVPHNETIKDSDEAKEIRKNTIVPENMPRMESNIYNKGTEMKQLIVEEVNAAENRAVLIQAFKDGRAKDIADAEKSEGQACIVLGSGATIEDILPLLKDWKGGLIVSTSQAVSCLYYDIEPTHIIALDPFANMSEIEGLDWSKTKTKLITTPSVWPDLIAKWPNDYILYLQNNGRTDSFYMNTMKHQYTWRSGATYHGATYNFYIRTAISLFSCSPPAQMFAAALLGYDKIFLAGCDFAFTKDKHRFSDWTINKFGKWEQHYHPIPEVTREGVLYNNAMSNNGILTTTFMLFYKKNMISAIRLLMEDKDKDGKYKDVKIGIITHGAMDELPYYDPIEVIEKQGQGIIEYDRNEQIYKYEKYLSSVGCFILESKEGLSFVEAEHPLDWFNAKGEPCRSDIINYMLGVSRNWKCKTCNNGFQADNDNDVEGQDCPLCHRPGLTRVAHIDIDYNVNKIRGYLRDVNPSLLEIEKNVQAVVAEMREKALKAEEEKKNSG